MIDILMTFKFYYLPTFQNYFSVFLIFLFVPGVFCCQHFSGSSRVDGKSVERGLRLDRDLERLWWKLFIHVNSDLSEISQEQIWLLDTSASRGRQSVAKMMTSFAFSCLSHHLGVIGDAETPRFPCCQRSHGTPGPKSLARQPTHRSTPTRSQAGDLVGKYGGDRRRGNTQFPRCIQSHGTPGPKSPARRPTHRSTTRTGDSTFGSSVPHSPPQSKSKRPVERPSSSDTGHSAWLATKGSVQQSLINQPVYSEHVPVTQGPGKTRYRSNDRYLVPVPGAWSHRLHRVHRPHRVHLVHQSHRVHRSHRVRWSDQSTLVRKLKRKRPTSAWTGLSFLFLCHWSDWCN